MNPHNLAHVIEDGQVIAEDASTRDVCVRWPDGSEAWLYYHPVDGWCFAEDNRAYAAGFAYAAGYPD